MAVSVRRKRRDDEREEAGRATQQAAEAMQKALSVLTPLESRVLRWRFGLDNQVSLTAKEIWAKYNLSVRAIYRIQAKALYQVLMNRESQRTVCGLWLRDGSAV